MNQKIKIIVSKPLQSCENINKATRILSQFEFLQKCELKVLYGPTFEDSSCGQILRNIKCQYKPEHMVIHTI